jgi:hypothetical protein
MVDREPYVKP